MKQVFLLIAGIVCMTSLAMSQDKFTQAMKKNIAQLDSTYKPEGYAEMGNSFQRIAEAEKTQWLPFYYAAYCRLMNGLMLAQQDPSKSDMYADQGEELLNKALALTQENSEIHCLQKIVATLRMLADPMSRYQQYAPLGAKHLQKAKELDATNPRADLLEAQDLLYTPEQFGGDKKKAVAMLQATLVKYQAFKPASEIHPQWGKTQVQYLLQQAGAPQK